MDPSLGRFVQPDTITPGGPQGLDRYSYIDNNPLNANDPTGHTCEYMWYSGHGIPQNCKQDNYLSNVGDLTAKTAVSLICGDDTHGDCVSNDLQSTWLYFGVQSLNPYRQWAQNTASQTDNYSTGTCNRGSTNYANCLSNLNNVIVGNMKNIYSENKSTNFLVVGFSGGGPFATGVASTAIDKSLPSAIPGKNITVVELDSMINKSNNEQEDIDNLIANGVSFYSVTSWYYQWKASQGKLQLTDPHVETNIIFHQWLANSSSVFNQYILPNLH